MTDDEKRQILEARTSSLIVWLVKAEAFIASAAVNRKDAAASLEPKYAFVRDELDRRMPLGDSPSATIQGSDSTDYDRSEGT